MNWNKEKLEKYLNGKENRSVDIGEYITLISFIKKIRPTTLIDIGTYLGSSGYILGTCCDSIENIYSIDNIDSSDYYPKPETPKEEHGMYLPNNAIFLKKGYDNGVLDRLIEKHPDAFVFWDAGKNPLKVLGQFKISYENNIKYIALHDTNLKRVRKVINRVTRMNWYEIIEDNVDSCSSKGVTIFKRRE